MAPLSRTRALAGLGPLLALALPLAACDPGPAPDPDAAVPDAAVPDGGDAAPDGGGGCPGATLCGDTEIVVDGAWLSDHLGDPDLQVVDTRGAAEHAAARIPGALLVDVGALRATVDGVGGQVVDVPTAEAALSAAGVRRDAAVVVYGPDTTTTPARLVWTLEYFGHARVALLDGGFDAWSAAGRATESGAAPPIPSSYAIDAVDADRRVDVDFILPTLGAGTLALVDARTPGEYDAGHLPGALSVNWTRNVLDGALRPDAELTPLYAPLDPAVRVATYCQTGSRASVAYVVLRALGFADVRLYDGSWAEWGARPELPREP